MTLKSVATICDDGSPDIKMIVRQIQALTKTMVVPGAITAGQNIAVAGIKTSATVVSAIVLVANTVAAGALFKQDVLAQLTVPTAGNIQLSAYSTLASETLELIYFNHD
jgi:hypothetical protein